MAVRMKKTTLAILIVAALCVVAGSIVAVALLSGSTGVVGWFFDREARAERFLEEARALAEGGNSDAAIIQYKNVIDNDPDNAAAMREAAELYLDAADLNGAYKYFKMASEKEPHNVDVLIKLAYCYHMAAQWRDLEEMALRIISLEPSGPIQAQAHHYLAQTYLKAGKYEAAQEQFARSIALDETNIDALLARALLLAKPLARPDEAKEVLQALLDRVENPELEAPAKAEAAVRAAKFYADTRQGKEAEVLFKAAIALQKNEARYYISLGDFYKRRASDAESVGLAEQAYQKALEVAPQDLAGFLALGLFYRQTGQADKAINVFKRAIDILAAPIYYQHLIEALVDTGEIDAARSRLEELRAQRKSGEIADFLEGRIYLSQARGRSENLLKAQQLFSRVTKLEPRFPHGHYYLGITLATRGMYTDAEIEFRRALELDGRLAKAQAALAETLMRAYEFHKAIEEAGKLLSRDPDDFTANLIVGRALMAQGRLETAGKYLQRARSTQPQSVEPYIALADLFVRGEDYTKAMEVLEEAEKSSGDSNRTKVRMAKALVRRQEGKVEEALEIASELAAGEHEDARDAANAARFYSQLLWRENQKDAALDFLKARVQEYAGDVVHLTLLGDFQRSVGQMQEAVATYSAALELAPKNKIALAGIAEAYISPEVARFDLARRKVKALREEDQYSPEADLIEARILQMEGNAPEAQALLVKSLRRNDTNSEAHYQLAMIQQESGELDRAIENLRAAVKYSPSSVTARLALAQAYYRTRFYAQALQETKKITNSSQLDLSQVGRAAQIATGSFVELGQLPEAISQWSALPSQIRGTGDYKLKLGYLYLMEPQYESAEKAFLEAAELLDEPALAYEGLAQSHVAQNDFEKAAGYVEKALVGEASDQTRLRLLQLSASMALSRADREGALRALEEMLAAAGKDAGLLLQAGDAFYALGQNTQAIEAYRSAMAAETGGLRAERRLISALTSEGRLDEAAELVAKLREKDPNDFDTLVLESRTLLAETPSRAQEAAELLRNALKLQGIETDRRAVARYLLGEAYYRGGLLPSAESELRRALTEVPRLVPARLLLAQVLLMDRSYEEAAVAARAVIEVIPGNAKAHGFLGDAEKGMGNLDRAVKEYRTALGIQKNPAYVTALATTLSEQGKTTEATAAIDKYVAEVPADVKMTWTLAQIHAARENFVEAEKVLGRGLRATPKETSLESLLAYVLIKQEKHAAAETLLQAAIEDHPYEGAYRMLGSLCEVTGRRDEAKARFKEGIAAFPGAILIHEDLASLHATDGKPELAIQVMEEAIAANSDNEAFYSALSVLYLKLDREEQAERFLSKTSEAHPDFTKITCKLGALYLNRGDNEKALETYERALRYAPENPEALNGVAYVLSEVNRDEKDLKRAVELATMAILKGGESAEVLDTLGWAYYKSEDWDKAMVNLSRAAELSRDSMPVIVYHLALAYDRRGAKSLAKETAQKLVALDSTYSQDDEIKAILAN